MGITRDENIVTLRHPSGSAAQVALQGATVFSWKSSDGKEHLFRSNKSPLEGPAAIRGGIPVCWPVFGPPPANAPFDKLKQHGFARTSVWTFVPEENEDSNVIKANFTLETSDEIAKIFSHSFSLLYTVTLTQSSLSTCLKVTNPSGSTQNLSFQALLHNYLQVSSVQNASLVDLKGTGFVDKVDGAKTKQQSESSVVWTGETDRVYQNAPNQLELSDNGKPYIKITKENLSDVVVWNPSQVKGDAIGDMHQGGWQSFVCVEPGQTNTFVELKPGTSWTGSQQLSFL